VWHIGQAFTTKMQKRKWHTYVINPAEYVPLAKGVIPCALILKILIPRTLFSTGILNKNESCKAIRIHLNLISFAKKMSLLLVLIFQMPWHKSSLSRQYFALNAGFWILGTPGVTEIEKLSIILKVSHNWKLVYCRIYFTNIFSIFIIFPRVQKNVLKWTFYRK
jgi:hypothetical protein